MDAPSMTATIAGAWPTSGDLPAAREPLPPALRTALEEFFATSLAEVRVRVGPEPARKGRLLFGLGTHTESA